MSAVAERPTARRTAAVGGTAVAALIVVAFAAATLRSGDDDAGVQLRAGDVTVSDAWMSVSLDVGAGYVTFENAGEADTLVGASSPAAATVSLMDEEHSPGGHDGEDHVRFDLPAGTTRLEPGVGHVMLQDFSRALEAGDVIDLVLTFERAGTVTVPVEVLSWDEVADRLDR